MKASHVFNAIFSIILKVVVVVGSIVVIYRGATMAYDYGYRLFTEPPVSEGTGREVTVSITSGKKAKEVGELLESKGLIRDAKLFYMQELFSDYHGKIKPGIYTLNSSMTAEEILEVICPPEAEEESEEEKK